MKRLFLVGLIFILGSTFNRAQEVFIGELLIDFVELPEYWDLDVTINAIGAVWDDDYELTESYEGGFKYYNENSEFVNHWPGHTSDACWDYVVGVAEPILALGLYLITVAQSEQESETSVSFYFDWRTSDLPGRWHDQIFKYSHDDNVIYRHGDPNKTNIDGDRLYIWDEIDSIDHITSGLELYLTVSNQNDNPYLEWSAYHDEYIDGYNVYRKITTSSGTITEVEFTTNTYYLDENFEIDPKYGDDQIEYWIKAKISSTEESLEGNHVGFVGTSVIQWKNSVKESNNDLNYSLNQNYPNPFNPVTTIEFTLKESSSVSLRVFDILGREVKTIINERLEAGIHQVEFYGGDLESGIYFYEIQANNFRDVKKLILLK